MSSKGGIVRRNRVREGPVALVAVAAGAAAANGGARPLESVPLSVSMTFAAVALTTWACASVPWWGLALASAVGVVAAADTAAAVAGLLAFGCSMYIGVRRRDLSVTRAVVGGLALNALAHSELEGFFGLSSIIGVTTGVMLIALGVSRRPYRIRRPAIIGAVAVALMAVGGIAMTAAATVTAGPGLTAGADLAQRGIDAVELGDYASGADLLERAALEFDQAADRLGGPVAAPGQLIPGVAQNLAAGADLADSASSGAAAAAAALRQVDAAELGVEAGQVSIDAIASIEEPLVTVQSAVAGLRAAVDDAQSPWLVAPIQHQLDELANDFDSVEPQIENAVDAVRLAPGLLGAEGPRRYLMLFASPSEARGLGGFVGNYAELEVDGGVVTVSDFDRRSELQAAALENDASCAECPEEMLAGYGQFIARADGSVLGSAWQNLTMPSHFPHVAETAHVLYPQSGGGAIDGVIVLDPYVVQELMKYTGPIELPDFGVRVKPADSAQFILVDQYVLAGDEGNEERKDALQALGEQVIARLLSGSLPEPAVLAHDLAPLVDERRLMFWTDEAAEQDLLERTGLLGNVPELGPAGGFSAALNNSSANKIEVFLDRDVSYRVDVDDQGARRLVADVVYTNDAPATGHPRFLIGNAVGLPDGTNRALVTFYGPPGLDVATLNGERFEYGVFDEAGWVAYRHSVIMGPGERAIYHLEWPLDPVAVHADEPSVAPATWAQPLVDRAAQ